MSNFDGNFGEPFDISETNSNKDTTRSLKRRHDETKINDNKVLEESKTPCSLSTAKKNKAENETRDKSLERSLDDKRQTHHQNKDLEDCDLHRTNLQADKTRLETILRDVGQETKMIFLKWAHPFTESEAFEAFCPSRLDELLREALQLESHLKKQKEQLKNRLTHLSKTLKLQMQ